MRPSRTLISDLVVLDKSEGLFSKTQSKESVSSTLSLLVNFLIKYASDLKIFRFSTSFLELALACSQKGEWLLSGEGRLESSACLLVEKQSLCVSQIVKKKIFFIFFIFCSFRELAGRLGIRLRILCGVYVNRKI